MLTGKISLLNLLANKFCYIFSGSFYVKIGRYKKKFKTFCCLHSGYFISLILQSCSNESIITSPSKVSNKAKSMGKIEIISPVKFNHSLDTLITLPKSKKEIEIPKNLPIDKINLLDKYLSTHNISNKKQSVQPNTLPCGLYISTYYDNTNIFEPADSKYIGIWTDYLNTDQCINYGFNQYFISDYSGDINQIEAAISGAYNSGFAYSNLMVSLGTNYNKAMSIIYNNPYSIGYYYVDEPYERSVYTTTQFAAMSSLLSSRNSSCKIFVSSYTDPNVFLFPNDVAYYTYLTNNSNVYIQNDEYYGNCFGHTYEYWEHFKNIFQSKNISDWMHVVINNGNGSASSCGYAATSWQTLISTADDIGVKNIWLYAYQTGNEAAVANFSAAAWQAGWMYRYQNEITTVWKCDTYNPCTNCIWPNGNWYVYEEYISGGRWVSY